MMILFFQASNFLIICGITNGLVKTKKDLIIRKPRKPIKKTFIHTLKGREILRYLDFRLKFTYEVIKDYFLVAKLLYKSKCPSVRRGKRDFFGP